MTAAIHKGVVQTSVYQHCEICGCVTLHELKGDGLYVCMACFLGVGTSKRAHPYAQHVPADLEQLKKRWEEYERK